MSDNAEYFDLPDMPYSLENEQSVLGALLLEPGCINDERVARLEPEHFYLPQHQAIFGAMAHMNALNLPIDPVTLLEQLRSDGDYEKAGGKEYLTRLAQLVPSITNVGTYAEAVKEKAMVRQLILAGREIVEDAKDPSSDAVTKLDAAEQRLYNIRQGDVKGDLVVLRNIMTNETLPRLNDMNDPEKRKLMKGISTGLSTLDAIIGGLHQSDLVIIGARPGMGKTSLILNMARHISVTEKRKVAFFSLEMTRDQLAQRMLSFDAAIDVSRLREGGLTAEEWDRIVGATTTLHEATLWVDETSKITVQQIKAKLRRNKPDIVFVDYLQLITPVGGGDSRVQQVAEMTRELKIMAKELNIPVVVCSQLNRAGQARGTSHMPQLSDLRDSGSIEQDADIVMLLHRPHYYDVTENSPEEEGNDPDEALCIVAKNRHGPAERARLRWDGRYAKFVAVEENLEY